MPQLTILNCSNSSLPTMESVVYISISESKPTIGHCPVNALATCWEIFFASLTALICTSYALHHEQRITNTPPSLSSQIFFSDTGVFSLILDPSPGLMLAACILLGCSISSFAYRRQNGDHYQPQVFAVGITAATVIGICIGMDATLVMLALVPVSLVGAMAMSVGIHWALRQLRQLRPSLLNIRIRCVERGEPLSSAQPLHSELSEKAQTTAA